MFKLLPRFNPRKDTAGFQLIPRDFGIPDVHVVPNLGIPDAVCHPQTPHPVCPRDTTGKAK